MIHGHVQSAHQCWCKKTDTWVPRWCVHTNNLGAQAGAVIQEIPDLVQWLYNAPKKGVYVSAVSDGSPSQRFVYGLLTAWKLLILLLRGSACQQSPSPTDWSPCMHLPARPHRCTVIAILTGSIHPCAPTQMHAVCVPWCGVSKVRPATHVQEAEVWCRAGLVALTVPK
jgi:hypothetical protein